MMGAGASADDRAQTLFRITEEAMHNVERHSAAPRVFWIHAPNHKELRC